MNEKIKNAVKAVAGVEETLDNLPISGRTGAKVGLLVGLYGGPVGTGAMLGLLGAYGASKVAQAVVERNNW